MQKIENAKSDSRLLPLSKSWAVAELKVSYKSRKKTSVFVNNEEDAYRVFRQMWDDSLIDIQEQFYVLFLNKANEVIGFRLIGTGTDISCLVDSRLIVTCALLCRATGIILAHNHPSGNLNPSQADKELTLSIKHKLNFFDISLLDHLIITDRGYSSII